jgi:hypothetical protein
VWKGVLGPAAWHGYAPGVVEGPAGAVEVKGQGWTVVQLVWILLMGVMGVLPS